MKPCLICESVDKWHHSLCTPALRRLVRAAERWAKSFSQIVTPDGFDIDLYRAVRVWKKWMAK